MKAHRTIKMEFEQVDCQLTSKSEFVGSRTLYTYGSMIDVCVRMVTYGIGHMTTWDPTFQLVLNEYTETPECIQAASVYWLSKKNSFNEKVRFSVRLKLMFSNSAWASSS